MSILDFKILMNQRHWFPVCLVGLVPATVYSNIFQHIRSYWNILDYVRSDIHSNSVDSVGQGIWPHMEALRFTLFLCTQLKSRKWPEASMAEPAECRPSASTLSRCFSVWFSLWSALRDRLIGEHYRRPVLIIGLAVFVTRNRRSLVAAKKKFN